ncbi:MAG TPA: hypothetical protein H9779_04160 [Candidatus Alistipes avicola]|uniref:Uncharacterized protein n=1 Tax=Candidatus Alistipes avicola TaxID=2838432 RepID=A0A9D2ICM2_9BACT|nr:hypothetical protein [uncultured Alistipes sp.]HJA98780.1 hypothetical protein [Candidatus Alistipes avicola]
MNFTKQPDQFASIYGDLSYSFTGASSSELLLNILDVSNGKTLGSKRYFNTTSGTTNIAPMIRKNIRFTPQTGRIGFYEAKDRGISVQLSGDNTFSEVRTFLATKDQATTSSLLTSMPRQRIIAYGEYDEITCLIPSSYTVSLQSDTQTTPITFNYDKGQPLTIFRLETGYFPPSTKTISLEIIVEKATIDRIDYTVVPASECGCRLAWRSSAGSIEHYTFPVIKSIIQKTDKEQIYTSTNGYIDTCIKTEQTTSLTSAYEPTSMILALSELFTSPQVWRVRDTQYEEVDLHPTEQTIFRHGTLCGVEVSIRPKFKKKPLWN